MQGKISAEDIKRISKELGEHFTDAEIQLMIEGADQDRKFKPSLLSVDLFSVTHSTLFASLTCFIHNGQ